MLDCFKSLLAENANTQTIVAQLSKIQWVYALNSSHLEQLTKIVQGKVSGYKIHPKVLTAIYSIIILRDHRSYNTKLAIESLSKYYRQLNPPSEQQTSTAPQGLQVKPANKTRLVVANLLLKIPTFSNYKMIIRDISPQLTSFSLFMEHRNAISKQCPNLYRQFVLTYRNRWPALAIGDQANYEIGALFSGILDGLVSISQQQNIVHLYKEYNQVQKILDFTRSRISLSTSQQLNIQTLFTSLQKMVCLQPGPEYPDPTSSLQFLEAQSTHIKNIKNSAVELLRLTVSKFKHSLCRKFKDVYDLVDAIRFQKDGPWGIEPIYYLGLQSTLLEVFGSGFMDFDAIVGKQDNDNTSIITLISALCYNDYSHNTKPQQQKINHQSKSQKSQNKKQIHLHLYTSTQIDSSYQNYLKKTTQKQREKLLLKILEFLTLYYNAKYRCSKEMYKSSHILHILGTSKNCISQNCLRAIDDLKSNVLFRGFRKIGEGFQNFCSEVFEKYIKKKQQRNIKITKSTIQVAILPTKQQSNSKKQSHIIRSNTQQLKRTNSFEVEFEGWGSQHKNQKQKQEKHKEQKEQRSEMFYSIKQCSENEEKDKQKQQEEHSFLLTPEF